jgi:glycosyltransferase involved in cell wall biosynthesis
MIVNSIRLFAQKGISVDVYISKKSFGECPITFFDSSTRIFIFDDKGFGIFLRGYRFIMKYASNFIYPLLKRCSLRTGLMVTFPEVYRFSSWLKSLTDFDRYDYVFPVECHSLISLYDMLNKDKLVYYNLELLNWSANDMVYGNKLILKDLEYRLIQSLKCVVLPSHARAESFCRINEFAPEKTQILPVAAMGNPISKKSKYFRKKFSIPDDHIVIVYSGNFVPWFQCTEIIDAMRACRHRAYSLVMHTWCLSSTETSYFKDMMKHAFGLPVFFSSEYISYDNLTEVLSSADIGLAFYESLDDNFTEILFSSNKIGEYLKAGLPIITSNFKPLHDFVHNNKIGITVPVQDISKAIEEISGQLGEYKSNALACYQANYRFELYFENYYQYLYMHGR